MLKILELSVLSDYMHLIYSCQLLQSETVLSRLPLNDVHISHNLILLVCNRNLRSTSLDSVCIYCVFFCSFSQ